MKVVAAITCCLLTWVLPAQAQDGWLNQYAMRQTFGGHTIDGRYASGLTFTETYSADGSISYTDDNFKVGGNWRVTSQGFCTFYSDMVGGCFKVRKLGNNCFEFYLTESQDRGPEEKVPFVAQGWFPDSKTTCEFLGT